MGWGVRGGAGSKWAPTVQAGQRYTDDASLLENLARETLLTPARSLLHWPPGSLYCKLNFIEGRGFRIPWAGGVRMADRDFNGLAKCIVCKHL